MSRDGAEFDADLWTETAMSSDLHWQEFRTLAIAVRDAFGWSADVNPEQAGETAGRGRQAVRRTTLKVFEVPPQAAPSSMIGSFCCKSEQGARTKD
jgi:hypothetical protein